MTTGEAGRERLIREAGLDPWKVVSIPTGVDLDCFDPSKVDGGVIRMELGIGEKTPLLGVVAVLRRRKGHRVFLEACCELSKTRLDCRFLVVGDGPMMGDLEEQVQAMGLQGRVFMNTPADCPFQTARRLVTELKAKTPVIAIDMHCEATSEKIAMGWWLDGQASFVFGTHTHIQTADERVLPQGTAYITDCGMTGPYESVIGRRVDRVLHRFTTGMPAHFDVATGDVRLCGALATIDSESGRALEVRRVVIYENGTVK